MYPLKQAILGLSTIALVFASAPLVLARDVAPVPGHLVLAKPGARPQTDALLIWDATPVVVSIVTQKIGDADANALLERDAIRDIAKLLSALSPDAKAVTLRVTYQKIGAVNPEYGAQTFAGVERYAEVHASTGDLRSNKDRWASLDDKAPLPAWFTFSVTGSLPPRH